MWRKHNENPQRNRGIDCTIRAIATATGQSWDATYWQVCLYGYILKDMPTSNAVWGAYLRSRGFVRRYLPDKCPDCYAVEDFCREHPEGTYILALQGHVVAVIDGEYWDTWDSGHELPIYYWHKED